MRGTGEAQERSRGTVDEQGRRRGITGTGEAQGSGIDWYRTGKTSNTGGRPFFPECQQPVGSIALKSQADIPEGHSMSLFSISVSVSVSVPTLHVSVSVSVPTLHPDPTSGTVRQPSTTGSQGAAG